MIELNLHWEHMEVPSSWDNSATNWFPPIGNQGSEGSCVSWACGYYTKTFQEAKEHNWNLFGMLMGKRTIGRDIQVLLTRIKYLVLISFITR